MPAANYQANMSRSYRPKGYGMSPGLQRARRPFRLQNAITGVALAGFAVAVWAYSISAVKQDEFTDIDALVPPPDVRRNIRSIEDEQKEAVALREAMSSTMTGPGTSPVVAGDRSGILQPAATSTPDATLLPPTSSPSFPPSPIAAPRGVVPRVLGRISEHVLHPTGGTLVWGAPNVEQVGRLEDRRTLPNEPRLV